MNLVFDNNTIDKANRLPNPVFYLPQLEATYYNITIFQ